MLTSNILFMQVGGTRNMIAYLWRAVNLPRADPCARLLAGLCECCPTGNRGTYAARGVHMMVSYAALSLAVKWIESTIGSRLVRRPLL